MNGELAAYGVEAGDVSPIVVLDLCIVLALILVCLSHLFLSEDVRYVESI